MSTCIVCVCVIMCVCVCVCVCFISTIIIVFFLKISFVIFLITVIRAIQSYVMGRIQYDYCSDILKYLSTSKTYHFFV